MYINHGVHLMWELRVHTIEKVKTKKSPSQNFAIFFFEKKKTNYDVWTIITCTRTKFKVTYLQKLFGKMKMGNIT